MENKQTNSTGSSQVKEIKPAAIDKVALRELLLIKPISTCERDDACMQGCTK